MTITLERPVSSGPMTDEAPPFLTRADVGRLIGIEPATVSDHLYESKEGRRYADHPFPEPNGRTGGRPWWSPDRADEIRQWAADRVGQGVGGGQPSHGKNNP